MKLRTYLAFVLGSALVAAIQVSNPYMSYSAAIPLVANVVVHPSVDASYQNGSVTVSWDSVTVATQYTVRATQVGTSTYVTTTVSGAGNTQAVVSNLIGGASYIIQVRTISNLDYSDWTSNSLTALPTTLPKAPGKPTAVPDVGSATISWTPLAGLEDGGSEVTSYLLTETNSGNTLSVGPSTSSATMTGLTEGSTAAFTVTAITAVNKTGSTSVASDQVTIGSSSGGGGGPSASPTPTAGPTVVQTAQSNQQSGGGGGGGGGGGFFGGGGGAPMATANPFDTHTATSKPIPTPTPTPSPTPSATVTPTPTPMPTPTPTPSATKVATKVIEVCTTAKAKSAKSKPVVSCKSVTVEITPKPSAKPSVKVTPKVTPKSSPAASRLPAAKTSVKSPTPKASAKSASAKKQITITCTNGKKNLAISGSSPACPAGFHRE